MLQEESEFCWSEEAVLVSHDLETYLSSASALHSSDFFNPVGTYCNESQHGMLLMQKSQKGDEVYSVHDEVACLG